MVGETISHYRILSQIGAGGIDVGNEQKGMRNWRICATGFRDLDSAFHGFDE
jgi:hypothetical protein